MENEVVQQLLELPEQAVCTYYEDKKVRSVGVDLKKGEHIMVEFEKGYVVVKTETETKFVCKGSLFISLWR